MVLVFTEVLASPYCPIKKIEHTRIRYLFPRFIKASVSNLPTITLR